MFCFCLGLRSGGKSRKKKPHMVMTELLLNSLEAQSNVFDLTVIIRKGTIEYQFFTYSSRHLVM